LEEFLDDMKKDLQNAESQRIASKIFFNLNHSSNNSLNLLFKLEIEKVNELAKKILDSNGKELKINQDLSKFPDNKQLARFAQDVNDF